MRLNKYNANLYATGNTPEEVKKNLEVMIKELEVKKTELYGYVWICNVYDDKEKVKYDLEVFDSEEKLNRGLIENIVECRKSSYIFYKDSEEEIKKMSNLLIDSHKEVLEDRGYKVQEIKDEIIMKLKEQIN